MRIYLKIGLCTVPELTRMGAKIILEGKRAIIEGDIKFRGAPVMCTDLRASAAPELWRHLYLKRKLKFLRFITWIGVMRLSKKKVENSRCQYCSNKIDVSILK